MVVAGIEIEVERKAIRNMHLAVYPPDGRVHISVPEFCTDDDVRAYVLRKTEWIRRQIASFATCERESVREYVSGENHYLFGKRYVLKVVYADAPPMIKLGHKYMTMQVRKGATVEKRAELMHEFYRQQLADKLPAIFDKWSAKTDEHHFTWSVRIMKTQWGSCHNDKREIFMNLLLARVPIPCIEYVAVHELTHLKVRHHSHAFELYLTLYMPDWRSRKQELDGFIVGEWQM